MTASDGKTACQAQLFINRLIKRSRHLKKWARKNGISCYRLYDRDIPEIPVCLDVYEDLSLTSYAVLYLYERPYEKDKAEEELWLNAIKKAACSALHIAECNIFTKTRYRQRKNGSGQYQKQSSQTAPAMQTEAQKAAAVRQSKDSARRIIVQEQGLRFYVNLVLYLDPGLFFDHRILRQTVRGAAQNKTVLNLFCYTGSFSVYAASGGAHQVTSVDLSSTYLDWAHDNLVLNGFTDEKRYPLVKSDVLAFLQNTHQSWDIIILDPPTFSNSKKMNGVLDINRDWQALTALCLKRLNKGGTLYFSSNSRTLKFDEDFVRTCTAKGAPCTVTAIGERTIPEDFRNKRIHRCWQIDKT